MLSWFCETRFLEGIPWINWIQSEEARRTEPLCSWNPLSLSSGHTKDDSVCCSLWHQAKYSWRHNQERLKSVTRGPGEFYCSLHPIVHSFRVEWHGGGLSTSRKYASTWELAKLLISLYTVKIPIISRSMSVKQQKQVGVKLKASVLIPSIYSLRNFFFV